MNNTDSLGLLASDSHIIIAATQNEEVGEKYNSSIQVTEKPIADIWDEGAHHRDPTVDSFLC